MRNVDKIKNLEKELWRYRKKVADQNKLLQRAKKDLETAEKGTLELNRVVDTLLTQMALTHGTPVQDEESGEKLGYRLELPLYSVAELHSRYEVRARVDKEKMMYIIGVAPREGREDAADRD